MSWIAKTLWDLIAPQKERPSAARKPRARGERRTPRSGGRTETPMQARYDALVIEMKRAYGVRVRKWRGSTTGCAWEVHYSNGSSARLIESPYPKGPMSCAIFLHEIGHHAIGFKTYKPRCLEEFHAWRWALQTMRERGLNVTDAVERRMAESLRYAVAKASRRGLRAVPPELLPFLKAPIREASQRRGPRSPSHGHGV